MKVLQGITGLLASRKGAAFILTLTATTALSATHRLDPTFGVVIGVIFGIFTVSHAYQEVRVNSLPDKGQV